jgi:hypothetical protein
MTLGEFEAAVKAIDPALTSGEIFAYWLCYCSAAGQIKFVEPTKGKPRD